MLGSKTPASFSGDLFDNQKIENLQERGTESDMPNEFQHGTHFTRASDRRGV